MDAEYFDGQSSRAVPVQLQADAAGIRFDVDDKAVHLPWHQIQWIMPVGKVKGQLELPGAGRLHGLDLATMQQLQRLSKSSVAQSSGRHLGEHSGKHSGGHSSNHSSSGFDGLALRLESSWPWVLLLLALTVAIVFSSLRYGLPAAAKTIAFALPDTVLKRMGEETLVGLDKVTFKPSALPDSQQGLILANFSALCLTDNVDCPAFDLQFRKGGLIGANALALPNGTVVITDELIELAEDDEEIFAILAHELGHVKQRHSMRMAIQSAGAGIILVAITGDISSVSDMASGLPSLLLQSGYSRTMETESDEYALSWMQSNCIAPQRFVDIMLRLDKSPDKTGLLDSHPGTLDRIERFKAANKRAGC